MKKLIMTTLLAFSLGITTPVIANASTPYSISYEKTATKHVTTTKTVKVYIIKPGAYEAANKLIGHTTLKKGSHIQVSQYFMSTGGYIIKNHGHFKPNSYQFYLVAKTPNQKWYK